MLYAHILTRMYLCRIPLVRLRARQVMHIQRYYLFLDADEARGFLSQRDMKLISRCKDRLICVITRKINAAWNRTD